MESALHRAAAKAIAAMFKASARARNDIGPHREAASCVAWVILDKSRCASHSPIFKRHARSHVADLPLRT
jgi:hypothetical protein